jgi:hypothetical protein
MTNYEDIVRQNLTRLYGKLSTDVEKSIGARKEGNSFYLRAFGEDCCIRSDTITLAGNIPEDTRGLLVSLYALHANPEIVILEPFKSFKDFPGSMPYQGAFSVNSEKVLIPHVNSIMERRDIITKSFGGLEDGLDSGDFSFILYPLPKVALCYVFYLQDDDFPASVTCLFQNNALSFMPLDGLADVAEYTSKGILGLLK